MNFGRKTMAKLLQQCAGKFEAVADSMHGIGVGGITNDRRYWPESYDVPGMEEMLNPKDRLAVLEEAMETGAWRYATEQLDSLATASEIQLEIKEALAHVNPA
jgi:hypothetical protein